MRAPPRAVWLSALAIAVFQTVGSFGAASEQIDRKPMDALAVALVLAGPVALSRRDRWPLTAAGIAIAAAVVYIGAGYAYGPIFLSVVVGLFDAVQTGRRRATIALAAAGYVAFAVGKALDPRDDGLTAFHLSLVAGWLAVVLAMAELVRVRRVGAEERRRLEDERRQHELGEQRLGLAQELHDVLAHNISLINVQASVALHLLDEQPQQARPALANIKAASHDALHELRTALDVLRRGDDAPRAPAPRLADLDDLVAGVRTSGLDVSLRIDGAISDLPPAVELAAFRIVQEALTNVTRHAQARHAWVRVERADGIDIEVTDDGAGGNLAGGAVGNGITGMRERAAALGGTLDAGPSTTGGFRVHAHIPERRP